MANDSADKSDSAYTPFKDFPPCVIPANKLQSILISQMQLETHQVGKRTAIHVIPPTIRRPDELRAVVEDQEGSVAVFVLCSYCQPFEEVVPEAQILQLGRWYLIKEPLARRGPAGGTCLIVEHPGDAFLLPHDHEFIPAASRKSDISLGESGEIRLKGNDAVGKKSWAEAEDLYSTAIRSAQTAEETSLAYLNRSLANLRLGRPATAFVDAIKSHGADISAPTEKALFREASALYDLAKYDQCLDRLQALKIAFPTNKSAIPMIDRTQARLKEQQTGQYDFGRMYKQAKATPPLIDCASYTMPVEIRDSPGKGRGVFTKRKVLAGELLICEKAFGYIHGAKGRPGRRDMTVIDVQNDLQTQIVQKLFHSIEDAQMFAKLYHGGYNAVPVDEVDGKPVIDSFLVRRVIELTNYRTPRTSLSLLRNMNIGNFFEFLSSTAGVWFFISHINHSCVSNTRRSSIGDMHIVRAAMDLEAGTELFSSYEGPVAFESYDETQERLKGWGFTCDCALCLERQATANDVVLKRKSLETQFFKCGDLAEMQNLLDQLEQTYDGAAKQPGAVRMEIWFFCLTIGGRLTRMGYHTGSIIEIALKGLEALGFVISARPRRGRPIGGASKPELRVIQWGQAQKYPIDAFRDLHLAYKTIAPQNAPAAKGYMEIAYTLFVGEKETMLETYPEMA